MFKFNVKVSGGSLAYVLGGTLADPIYILSTYFWAINAINSAKIELFMVFVHLKV